MAIKKFNQFEDNKFKNIEPVNEFFGAMIKDFFKNAKNQMSLKVSQKIGSAKEIDKAIEEYKSKLQPFIDQEIAAQKRIIEMKSGMDEGADDTELNKLKSEVEKEQQKIDAQKDAAKKTFTVKLNKITSDTDDKNVKYYANLKRAELAEQVLAQKLEKLEEIGGEQMEDDDEFKEMLGDMKKAGEKVTNMTKKFFGRLKDSLAKGGSEAESFNMENAKEDVDYKWEKSPYWKSDLKPGTELTYWSSDNYKKQGDEYKGTEGTVRDDQDIDDPEHNIAITTEANPNGFPISKGKIITTKADAEAKAKAGEEEEKVDAKDNEEMAEATGEEQN